MLADLPLLSCTNAKVRQLTRSINQHYDAEVAQSGLKTTQYSLLSNIANLGPVRPVDLAAALRMTASTLSRNVQPLIAAGWVAVSPGASARSQLLAVTPEGSAKRKEAQRHWKLAQKKLEDLLGREDVMALHALIDKSLATLGGDDLV
ncbi:MarR family transcriptional regulator [soil metagenome]